MKENKLTVNIDDCTQDTIIFFDLKGQSEAMEQEVKCYSRTPYHEEKRNLKVFKKFDLEIPQAKFNDKISDTEEKNMQYITY